MQLLTCMAKVKRSFQTASLPSQASVWEMYTWGSTFLLSGPVAKLKRMHFSSFLTVSI